MSRYGSFIESFSADQKYGWFSSVRALRLGTVAYYATPDGGRVAVTSISRSTTWSGAYHPDGRFVGPVTDFIERAPYTPPKVDEERCGDGLAIKRRDMWTGLRDLYVTRLQAMCVQCVDPN
nr:hypothetical protein [Pandoravirus massiliensis]